MDGREPVRERYLLDTVILVDHLNGIGAATAWLSALAAREAAISVVTRAEVLTGAEAHEMEAVRLLLGRYRCLGLGPAEADAAAELRRAHRWKLPDAFQAALARLHHLRLVTRNTRDFPPERFEFVLVPYRMDG
jgi:predicted nucleic acid-binding protein